MKNAKYKFKNAVHFQNKLLVCPKCLEAVNYIDIENFRYCPYCDYSFEHCHELEDFLLQPVVEHWMRQYSYCLRDESHYNRPALF
ncbi:MAG: hypothetical protein A2017_19925 [Lentisphaerae bacterium GWF2_44_16]|nr:MAG: hypothetical protein A2017_19925 [Lentisphaerae bacterium GWF2_44_16]